MGGSRWLRAAALVAGLALVTASCTADDGDGANGRTGDADDATDELTEEAVASAECGSGQTIEVGESEGALESSGVERTYFLSVPPAYDGENPLPLVLDFHGYLEGAQIHRGVSNLGSLGETEGFVTVTPQGSGEIAQWDIGPRSADVVFVEDLLDHLEGTLCLDTSRAYATGISNGALMTSTLACELSDRFAAAAPVAGIVDVERCDAGRPVPVVTFHGTEDNFVAFEGGLGKGALALPLEGGGTIGDATDAVPGEMRGRSIPDQVAGWAERNGCDPEAHESQVSEHVRLLTYESCDDDASVLFYVIDGGGHTWPGSTAFTAIESIVGTTTTEIDANELMWEFFQQYQLPN